MMLKKPLTVLAGMAVVLMALTACDPAGGGTTPAPSVSPSETTSASPSASPTPTPTPTTIALATECSELLSAASLATITSSGFAIPDTASIQAYVDKTKGEGNPLAAFVDGVGLLCPVTNGTRVSELFGFSPITQAEAAVQKARLVSEGLTLSSHLGGDLYSDTSGNENVVFVYLFVGGYWFCAIDVARLDEVVAHSGAGV